MAKQKTKSSADILAQRGRILSAIEARGGDVFGDRARRVTETAGRYVNNIVKNNKKAGALYNETRNSVGEQADNARKKGMNVQATRRQYMGLSKG